MPQVKPGDRGPGRQQHRPPGSTRSRRPATSASPGKEVARGIASTAARATRSRQTPKGAVLHRKDVRAAAPTPPCPPPWPIC